MENNRFGEMVRRLREQRGMTLTALAEKGGISKAYLCDIEHGHRRPAEAVMSKLAAALDIHSDDLMGAAGMLPSDLKPVIGRPYVVNILRAISNYTDRQLKDLEASL